jgi:hypothetical protein
LVQVCPVSNSAATSRLAAQAALGAWGRLGAWPREAKRAGDCGEGVYSYKALQVNHASAVSG